MATQLRVRVTVAPGDTRQVDDWSEHTITLEEASVIERAYGKSFLKFNSDMQQGYITALQVLAWVVVRRTNPLVKIADLGALALDDIEIDTTCSKCHEVVLQRTDWGKLQSPPLEFAADDVSRLDMVHDDGQVSCGDTSEPTDPTPAEEDQAPSAPPEPSE